MSNTQHTPGPWTWRMAKIERGPVGKGKTIHAALSAPRPNCPPPYSTGVITPNWCTDIDGQVWQAWVSVNEADARLIAAAPCLLEALREACKQARHPDYDWPLDLQREVDAAIAKATGGAV